MTRSFHWQRFLFLYLALALGVGIGLAPYLRLTPYTLAILILASVAGLVLSLGIRRRLPIALFLFLVVMSAGLIRGNGGDVHLLPNWLVTWAEGLRHACSRRLGSLGLSDESLELARAMLLGERRSLAYGVVDLYRDAGAAHLLALSGLHLTILFGTLHLGVIKAVAIKPLRRSLAVTGMLGLWGYAMLTGFPVSLLRASIMMSLLLLAEMRNFSSATVHSLGFTAFIILMLWPTSLGNISFQLSFASVASIFALHGPLLRFLATTPAPVRWLWSGLCASLAAHLGSLPLVIIYFHMFSPYGVLFGPIYILIATLFLYLVVFALLFAPTVFAVFFSWLASLLAGCQHGLMSFAVRLPGAVWKEMELTLPGVFLLYVAMALLAIVLRLLANKLDETM